MQKVLICGDIHGDWGHLNRLINKQKPDLVMQCGDFGWWPKLERTSSVLYHLKPWKNKGIKSPVPVLWCDGNHEDHWDLERQCIDMEGEEGVELYDNVHYMPRGTTFKLDDGRIVLFIGGADSIDKGSRTLGIDWFPDELINNKEFERAMSHDHIDIVISHTAPSEWVPNVCKGDKVNDPCRIALSEVLKKYKPEVWAHGHWHTEAKGTFGKTKWYALDYPGHTGRWWRWLDK